VVIHDFNFTGLPFAPRKTNPPLVIDADAVLTLSIAFKAFQAISWQRRERSEIRRGVEHIEFAKGQALNGLEPTHGFPAEQALGVSASEGPNHT
jgi:hypothetical protein